MARKKDHMMADDEEQNDQQQNPQSDQFPLTDECHHYESVGEVPWDIQKYQFSLSDRNLTNNHDRYWQQRYSIFSLYDEGIYMTDDAWFGVTPEPVAL